MGRECPSLGVDISCNNQYTKDGEWKGLFRLIEFEFALAPVSPRGWGIFP